MTMETKNYQSENSVPSDQTNESEITPSSTEGACSDRWSELKQTAKTNQKIESGLSGIQKYKEALLELAKR